MRRWMPGVAWPALLFLGAWGWTPAPAATFYVGPGRTYTVPSMVLTNATLGHGDTILIDAVTYTNDFTPNNKPVSRNNLVIRGTGGGRARLLATTQTPNQKGIWVIGGTNTTIENVEFVGCQVGSSLGGNGCGIRQEGDTLTLRNCTFSNNNDGVMSSASTTSDILFEFCEFYRNGYTNYADNPESRYVGYAHNMYVGNVRTFTMRYCYSHGSVGEGHVAKSRANTNYILYNRLTDESDGRGSYVLQLPQGGLSFVVGNLIEKGANNVNHSRIICYADENQNNPIQNLYFAHNTIVNDLAGYTPTFLYAGGSPGGKVVNNILIGPGPSTNGAGTYLFTNNLVLTYTQRTQLVGTAAFNYQLIPTATAIDQGVAPGVYSNFDLTPQYEYVHPLTGRVRAVEWKLDSGAYESTNAVGDRNGDGIDDNWQRRFFGTLANPAAAAGSTNANGFTTLQSFQAGLLPTDASSRLALLSVAASNGGCRVAWQGGTSVWQYVESCTNLDVSGGGWRAVYTNAPTLATSNSVQLNGAADPARYFRIRAGQP
jgi:hypothetical protein